MTPSANLTSTTRLARYWQMGKIFEKVEIEKERDLEDVVKKHPGEAKISYIGRLE